MYLAVDLVPTKRGFYVLEVNLGIAGGLSDIVEGVMHIAPHISKKFKNKPSQVQVWIDDATKLFSVIDGLSEIYYKSNFSEFAKRYKIMKDLKLSKISRRQGKPIPKELAKWTHFADKCYLFESLNKYKAQYFIVPETYSASSRSEVIKYGKNILLKGKYVIIKPARLWHGIGVARIKTIQELINFTPQQGYPCLVQEYVFSDFLNGPMDMRLIIMCGHLVGILIRVATGKSIVSNISAGGKVILCFPTHNKNGLIFKNIIPQAYTRNYFTEWEKILLEDFVTFREKKVTIYDRRACFVGQKEWNVLNNVADEIYRFMALNSDRSGVALPTNKGNKYLQLTLHGRTH